MSIRDEIKAHLGKDLWCLMPEFEGDETPRTVFVSREVESMVLGPWPESREGKRHAEARALLDAFTSLCHITITEDPFDKAAHAILARVHPVDFEIWDFRCLDPNPGIRILGCFSEADTFIALTWDYRENLEDSADWDDLVERCRLEWKRLFRNPPHKGVSLDAYVSCNFDAV